MPTFEKNTAHETKLMPARAQIIDSIKTKVLGKTEPADLREWFYHYPYQVDFFEIKSKGSRRNCIGFHLPEEKVTDGHIVLIHNSLKNLKESIFGAKDIRPDVVITFRKQKNGLLQVLMGGEGSHRIDILQLDANFKPLVFSILEEVHKTVIKYNFNKLKDQRKAKQKK